MQLSELDPQGIGPFVSPYAIGTETVPERRASGIHRGMSIAGVDDICKVSPLVHAAESFYALGAGANGRARRLSL